MKYVSAGAPYKGLRTSAAESLARMKIGFVTVEELFPRVELKSANSSNSGTMDNSTLVVIAWAGMLEYTDLMKHSNQESDHTRECNTKHFLCERYRDD